MRDDIPEAAFRLSCMFSESGKVRTHVRESVEKHRGGWHPKKGRTGERRVVTGVGRGGNQGKAVRIDGRLYKRMKDACKALHIGHQTLYNWLREGRAVREK